MAIDYYDDSYEEYDEVNSNKEYNEDFYHECEGYEWTMEDSWDALTDGMYGDMPAAPWEYDAMMDAMGF
jgi:hypothetical protein